MNNKLTPDNWLSHKISNNAVTFISVLAGVATIVSAAVTFIQTVIRIFVTKSYSFSVADIPITTLFILLAIFCVICFRWIVKYKRMIIGVVSATTKCMKQIQTAEKNAYYALLKYHKSETKDKVEDLTKELKTFLQEVLDSVCDVLEAYSGKNVSGCVKLIEKPSDGSTKLTYDNAVVSTICRSKESDPARGEAVHDVPARIKENTDFADILFRRDYHKSYFYVRDLEQYDEQLKSVNNGIGYQNTRLNWRQYYRGTIVMPVRIESSRLFFMADRTANNEHILAFLCFDSLSTDVFTENRERYIVDLVRGAADSIYLILNQYSYYLDKINEESTSGCV